MSSKVQYGQYCPLSMSAEFLCTRWSMLVLRELLFGSTTFNDISRGVPRMSRTLLSNRLKEFAEIGILIKQPKRNRNQADYILTEAGEALSNVVFSMAQWGQEWLKIEPSVKNLDADFLMWDIRRNTKPIPELPDSFIVHFFLTDVPKSKSNRWLVFEDGEVDLCYVDHDFNVDVQIEVSAKKLTKVWMGWENFSEAIADGSMVIRGAQKYIKLAESWLGQSSIAHIQKRPEEQRISS
jgi:DNA-binding HxlR family transcriptional regulator